MCASDGSSTPRRTTPSTGNRTTPSRFDRVTGVTSGAPPTVRRADAHSHDRQGDPQPLPAWAVGRRSPVEDGRAGRTGRAPRAQRHSDRCEVRRQQRTAVSGHLERSLQHRRLFITAAAFASDALTVGDRLTINAGLRFDHSRAISQDLHARRSRRARNRRDRPRPGHAVHLERVVAAPGRHREAQRRWPDDAAGELRAVQPGRADRRARPLPPRGRRRSRRPPSIRRPAATRASSRSSIPRSTCSSIPRRARRAPTSTPIGVDREVGRRLAVADRVRAQGWRQLHRLDGRRRSVSRGDADVARRPQRAGVRARQRARPLAAFC